MTERADDDWIADFFACDHYLPQVTPENIAARFAGFDLTFQHDKDEAWLAMAVRRALACTMVSAERGHTRTGNAEISRDLKRLATLVGSTWQQLSALPEGVESRVWYYSLHKGDGEDGIGFENGGMGGDPALQKRFNAAIQEMEWLQTFLNTVANDTKSQKLPWRRAELKQLRIERGHFLAPVFVGAFGEPVTVNNWQQDARHTKPTPFMDFYQRCVALAFGEKATDDLPGVLKIARRQHLNNPVQFTEGLIPGL